MLLLPQKALLLPSRRGISLHHAIKKCGLLDGLQICLDAGDLGSYDGSSQVWSDLSGNGYNFNRGTDNSATATDPTFNGTAGALTSGEFFGFDGGDVFRAAAAAAAWQQTWHKNNALFATVSIFYPVDANPGTIWANGFNNNGQVSTCLEGAGSSALRFIMNTGGGAGTNQTINLTGTYAQNAWNFHLMSVDEANAAGVTLLNKTAGTFTATYTSPSASDHSQRFSLGGNLSGTSLFGAFDNTSRFAAFAAWNARAIAADQGLALRELMAGRFGW